MKLIVDLSLFILASYKCLRWNCSIFLVPLVQNPYRYHILFSCIRNRNWTALVKTVQLHFLMTHVLQQQFSYCFKWSNNQFLILNIFSFVFLQTFFLLIKLNLLAIYQLTSYRISGGWSWLFLVLFRCCECWLPCISCIMCHIFLGVSN